MAMKAASVVKLKFKKLKEKVYKLTNTKNTKQLKKWLKNHKKALNISQISKLTKKDRLPNLRFRYNWEVLAIAIFFLLKRIAHKFKFKEWFKKSEFLVLLEYNLLDSKLNENYLETSIKESNSNQDLEYLWKKREIFTLNKILVECS